MTNQTPQDGALILYRTADDAVRVEVLYESVTVQLGQRRMAALFGVGVPANANHLANIYEADELDPAAAVSKMARVQRDGNREVRREIECQDRVVESDFAAELERTESKRPKKASSTGEQNP